MSTATYQAVVAATSDPLSQGRVRLQVPQLSGTTTQCWARPAFARTRVPAVGEQVWVLYEGGDTSQPVYMASPVAPSAGDYDPIEPLMTVQKAPVSYAGVQTQYLLFGAAWDSVTTVVPPSGSLFVSVSGTLFVGRKVSAFASLSWAIYDENSKAYVLVGGARSDFSRLGTLAGAPVPGVNGASGMRRSLAQGLTPGHTITVRPIYSFADGEPGDYTKITDGRLVVEPVPLSPSPPIATQQSRPPKFMNATDTYFPEDELAEITAVVPPSGKIFVSISGQLSPSSPTVGNGLWYSWTASSTTSGWTDQLSGLVKQVASINYYAACAGTRRTLLTGMTPGDVVRFRPAYGTNSSLSSTTFMAQNGEFVVEPVIDSPDLPVQGTLQQSQPIYLGQSTWIDYTTAQWAPITTKVPSTGAIAVSVGASMWSDESDTSELRLGWKITGDYAWSGDGVSHVLTTKGRTFGVFDTKRYILDGLTPGSTVTITPQYWCSANSTRPGVPGGQMNQISGAQLVVEPVRAGNPPRLTQQLAAGSDKTAHIQTVANSTVRNALRPTDGDAYVMADSETIVAKVNGKWLTLAEKKPYILVHADSVTLNSSSSTFPWTAVLVQTDSGLYSPQEPDALYTTKDGVYEIKVNCTWGVTIPSGRIWVTAGGKEFRVWSLEPNSSNAQGVSGVVMTTLRAGSKIQLGLRSGGTGTATGIRMAVEYKGPNTSGRFDNV
ncbi:phage baseplate assembly protein V [Streptomyces sp. NPDC006704]|uniref:phage baseplate assembly protein V n=1 Tax=Streptomyces sp. NPDC006704 TaxID=3364760 RepID=UPI0036CF20DC